MNHDLKGSPSYAKASFFQRIAHSFTNLLDTHPLLILTIIAIKLFISGALYVSTLGSTIQHSHDGFMWHHKTAIALVVIAILILKSLLLRWYHILAILIPESLLKRYQKPRPVTIVARTCRNNSGKIIATLTQEGTSPLFELRTEKPYEMGYAQGYIFAKEILDIVHLYLWPLRDLIKIRTFDLFGRKWRTRMKHVRWEASSLEEFQGIFDGIRQWSRETSLHPKLKLVDLQLFNAIIEVLQESVEGDDALLHKASSYATQEAHELHNPAVGVLLNLPSLGFIGNYFIIRRYTRDTRNITLVSLPGIIGGFLGHDAKCTIAFIHPERFAHDMGEIAPTIAVRRYLESGENFKGITHRSLRGLASPASIDETVAKLKKHNRKESVIAAIFLHRDGKIDAHLARANFLAADFVEARLG